MFQPIVIIGAARSGTNMLRDLLVKLPGVSTWDCDEINYIWRHGNASCAHDEFRPELASSPVQRFVRRAFERQARASGCRHVVEKTCANSLRVSFVDRILPEAKYVFLVRDGRDVVASARKRWTAPLDLRYIAKKARYVPKLDLPYYAGKYLGNRIYRLISGQKRLAFWGPQFIGIHEMLATHTLEQVCAAQWARSVARAREDFGRIDPARLHTIRYEDFVTNPREELQSLIAFLNTGAANVPLAAMAAGVGTQSVGNWRRELPIEVLASIQPIMTGQLKACGYAMEPAEAHVLERIAA